MLCCGQDHTGGQFLRSRLPPRLPTPPLRKMLTTTTTHNTKVYNNNSNDLNQDHKSLIFEKEQIITFLKNNNNLDFDKYIKKHNLTFNNTFKKTLNDNHKQQQEEVTKARATGLKLLSLNITSAGIQGEDDDKKNNKNTHKSIIH